MVDIWQGLGYYEHRSFAKLISEPDQDFLCMGFCLNVGRNLLKARKVVDLKSHFDDDADIIAPMGWLMAVAVVHWAGFAAEWKDGQVRYNKHFFKVWDSYGLSQYDFRSGSFTEDSRGRWYFNVVVQAPVVEVAGRGE